jgi:cystathionine beta-lyase/cystathionine gamma-synthase
MTASTPRSLRTRLVARHAPDEARQLPVAPPIVQSTTFVIDEALDAAMAAGDYRSQFLYTRMGNPTLRELERLLADAHGAEDAVVTASGMGALSAAFFALVPPGGAIVADTALYGVTATLLRSVLAPAGRLVRFVPLNDLGALQAALRDMPTGAWVLGETLSNPLVSVLDIPAVANAVHAAGARLIVDNTFASPAICRPLEHGADLVIESLSKAVAGHSDVHGGLVAGPRALVEPCWQTMYLLGACLDPHAAWLIHRGARTLTLRARTAASSAATLAAAMHASPHVERVYYPSLEGSVAPWLASGGSMLSVVVAGGDARAHAVLDALSLATPATSLGGVETLVSLPYNTSHRTDEARAAVGLRLGTIRVSVGCEDPDELVADFLAALDATSALAH